MKKRIEYEFTADDVAEWVRARIDGHVSLQGLFDTLKNLRKTFAAPTGGIIAFCEAREAERAEMESEPTDAQLAEFARVVEGKPALSRFLPVRPDDVPAPTDGWVYVGKGVDNKFVASSEHIGLLTGEGWSCGDMARCGSGIRQHYAVRWSAPADIWHRFGLLAPSEGGGWIPHTPFTPKPDNADARSDVLMDMRSGEQVACFCPTNNWQIFPVIGWRPALAEVRP